MVSLLQNYLFLDSLWHYVFPCGVGYNFSWQRIYECKVLEQITLYPKAPQKNNFSILSPLQKWRTQNFMFPILANFCAESRGGARIERSAQQSGHIDKICIEMEPKVGQESYFDAKIG